MNKNNRGFLSLISAAFIWGLAFICVDRCLAFGWKPLTILMIRGYLGALVLFRFSYRRRWWRNSHLVKLGIQNGTLFWCGFVLQTYGQNASSVPNAAFITTLNIVLVPIILHFCFHRRINKIVYLACGMALLGTALLSFDNQLRLHIGDIYLLGCAIFFALHLIHNEYCGKADNVLSIASIQLLTMGTLSLCFLPFSGQATIPSHGWADLLYLALFSSAAAGFLQMYGLKLIEACKASLILCQESVIATIFSVLLLDQPVTLKLVLGGSLMIGAVIIVEMLNNKKAKTQ